MKLNPHAASFAAQEVAQTPDEDIYGQTRASPWELPPPPRRPLSQSWNSTRESAAAARDERAAWMVAWAGWEVALYTWFGTGSIEWIRTSPNPGR